MNLAVLGVSFRTASIGLRERLAFTDTTGPEFLAVALAAMPDTEFVLISTCNRTELYAAGKDISGKCDALIRLLFRDVEEGFPYYFKGGSEAVQHLMAVVSGLESMVVGETEILGQSKRAYLMAGQAGSTGKLLDGLFQHAFRVAKRIHSETDLAHGRVSVSSIAVEFAEKIFGELVAKSIMIVGSGEMAELTLKSMVERPVREVIILNRSLERAQGLTEIYGGQAVSFDKLADSLARADVVISSTGCPHCIIHADDVRHAMRERRGQPMLLIDIAVPRDIEPEVEKLENVYLYHIDDLQKVSSENLARRQAVVGQAWDIVREETRAFVVLTDVPDIGLIMRQIDKRAADIREATLKAALAKPQLANLPEASREQVVRLAERITAKLLATSKTALREAARNGHWEAYSAMARELLGLDDEAAVDPSPPSGSSDAR